MSDLLPHLSGGPVVMCYDLQDTDRLYAAVSALFKKYPNATLACFDRGCYVSLQDVQKINVLFSPFMDKEVRKKYNVIGILCGSDRVFPNDGLKVMRV